MPGVRAGRVAIAVAVALTSVLAAAGAARPAGAVSISPGRVVAHTSPRYVSFAVDLAQVTGGMFWSQAPNATGNAPVARYDFARRRLRLLARALAPAYLRISGTAANETFYDLSPAPLGTPPAGYQLILTKAEWDAVGSFARELGLGVVLGINAGPGPVGADGHWLSADAGGFLRYTVRRRYPLAAVEFGNEPNLFRLSGTPASYSASDYVRDLLVFDALRRRLVPHTALIGPGSFYSNTGSEVPYGTPLGPLASQVMPAVPRIYDTLAFHEYPATSTRCRGIGTPVPADPLAPGYLDGVLSAYDSLKALGRRYDPRTPIWDTEGGSASCGGQQGYSNRFESTFWYLNALGLLARHGLAVFVRQTLSGSDYGLIDDATLQPNPDYWAALLWRRLMGASILAPRLRHAPARLRVYGACSRAGGGTTLLALNLDSRAAARLTLQRGPAPARVYLVRAPNLLGRGVRLNGRTLRTRTDGGPPVLAGKSLRGSSLVLPRASYAFIVQRGVGPAACR
jgi:heparanase